MGSPADSCVFSTLRVAIIALLSLIGSGCERLPTDDVPGEATAGTRAITFCDWTPSGYASQDAFDSLDELAATGANTVVLIVTAYQASIRSNGIEATSDKTPRGDAVLAAASRARDLGLARALKLHVDVSDGMWRGWIDPENRDAWFESYATFVLAWAAAAQSAGFAELTIGTELAMISSEEDSWRALIRDVRAVYAGRLLYAASWDEVARVPFWDALDAIGVDFYFPVARRPDAGRLEILAGWQPWLLELERIAARAGRPIVLTEVGYMSRDGAGMDPSRFDGRGDVDVVEQADLYWAALAAIGSSPSIAGVYIWNWLASSAGGSGNSDYTPRGKPAALVLHDAWSHLATS